MGRLSSQFDSLSTTDSTPVISVTAKDLSKKKQILDDFFDKKTGYTDKDIADLGVSKDELKEYADLGLGIKIRDCINAQGTCSFEAEL